MRGAKGLFELKRLLGGWICDTGLLGIGRFAEAGNKFEDGAKPNPGFDLVDVLEPERV
jgi:hypothetical protein